jgi:hypothetical protein
MIYRASDRPSSSSVLEYAKGTRKHTHRHRELEIIFGYHIRYVVYFHLDHELEFLGEKDGKKKRPKPGDYSMFHS